MPFTTAGAIFAAKRVSRRFSTEPRGGWCKNYKAVAKLRNPELGSELFLWLKYRQARLLVAEADVALTDLHAARMAIRWAFLSCVHFSPLKPPAFPAACPSPAARPHHAQFIQ